MAVFVLTPVAVRKKLVLNVFLDVVRNVSLDVIFGPLNGSTVIYVVLKEVL